MWLRKDSRAAKTKGMETEYSVALERAARAFAGVMEEFRGSHEGV